MERRRRQDDGSWNRPHYGSNHSGQPGDFYHEVSPQHHNAALPRTGPFTDFSHGRAQPPVSRDSRPYHQQYAQAGNQTFVGSHHGAMEPDNFHQGRPYTVGDHKAQSGLFHHGNARIEGPQGGIHHHGANSHQRGSQHGGPQPGIPPHMGSTDQKPYGGPQPGIPPHVGSTDQKPYGGPQPGIPPHMGSTDQRAPHHGGLQPGIHPHMGSTDQRGQQPGIPPHIGSTDQRGPHHGRPQTGIPSHMGSTDQKPYGGPQPGIPPNIGSTDQRGPHHGRKQPGIPPHMGSTDQRVSPHAGPPFVTPMSITEQVGLQYDRPQSAIPPPMSSNQHNLFQHGGPQSNMFLHEQLPIDSFHGQLPIELRHKGPGQDTFKVEEPKQQAGSFHNTPLTRDLGNSTFRDSQLERINPALNRPPINDMLQHRVSHPDIIQQSSPQLPPGSSQNIQHPNNPVQGQYSFPPPLHAPPPIPPNIPPFFHPISNVFSGPPREGGQGVCHIQHSESNLNRDPYSLLREGRSDNTTHFNVLRQDNLHQDIVPVHRLDPFTKMAGDLHFVHQQHFNNPQEKSLINPNIQSEMLIGKEEPSDKDLFQRWLFSFLACRRNNLPPKPDSKQSVSLPEARDLIYGALNLVSQLRSLCQLLENSKEEGPSWAQDYEKAKEIKWNLAKKIKELEKPGFMECVKIKLDRVRKKRLRSQRRRQAKEEEEKEAAERMAEREAEIDSWRMQCVQKVEEKKKERELKAAADSVLGEVRKKQADAKKMLDMLKSLEKLRKLRKEAALRKGVNPPPSRDETFSNHITRLRSLVHKRTALYDAEERALRVILEGEQEEERQREKDKRLKKQREKILQQQRELDSILFGDDDPLPSFHPLQPFRQYYLQAEHSVVSLVHIRREWDQFLAPPDHPDASSIPRGWVLPMPPSSEIWATALKPVE
ncbi:programmed cell death protein 7 [Pyxicephalus adspersus]|uniref:programmed cell death protein 7 n=1 Tax=Pyxicephalus adspersus TaxID=30357 RepID=UPI003B5A913C